MKKYQNILMGSLGLFLFLWMFFLSYFEKTEWIDQVGNQIGSFFQSPILDPILYFITHIMTFLGIGLIFLLLIYFLRKRRAHQDLFLFLITVVGGVGLNTTLKWIVQRTRPEEGLIPIGGFSFPSGHSFTSTLTYGLLILLLKKYGVRGTKQTTYIVILSIMIILTCFSRLYFNVHYGSDILGGFGLGLFILSLVSPFLKTEKSRREV